MKLTRAVALVESPPSEALAGEGGHFVSTRLELHDGDEPNGPLRVEDRMDAFNHLEDLGEVAFDVGSRGVGLDDQTGLLEQFVRGAGPRAAPRHRRRSGSLGFRLSLSWALR